jgi:hypothetical protein
MTFRFLFILFATTTITAAEEGFTSLFNGEDLQGWVGHTNGYAVTDRVLICEAGKGKGGNIFTKKEYENFVFRFEFKLTAGANNGVGLRAPLSGNASKKAYEVQILDNTAEKYAKLHPAQYHGSVYKMAAAKRGHLKPLGEWNRQEIRAEGAIISVILNGETIVDQADVAKYKRPPSGHIGFLGHGSYVEFRNIRIKELGARK